MTSSIEAHWDHQNNPYPTGVPQEFLLEEGDIVEYKGDKWKVVKCGRHSSNALTGEDYDNGVFSFYRLERYTSNFELIIQYICNADVKDIRSRTPGPKRPKETLYYTENYMEIIRGKQ